MKRSVTWLVFGAVGCGAKIMTPTSTPAIEGSVAEASASVEPLPAESASGGGAPRPSRPILTDARAKEEEEILRDVCPIHYVSLKEGGYAVAWQWVSD